jgi:hypothetical protein
MKRVIVTITLCAALGATSCGKTITTAAQSNGTTAVNLTCEIGKCEAMPMQVQVGGAVEGQTLIAHVNETIDWTFSLAWSNPDMGRIGIIRVYDMPSGVSPREQDKDVISFNGQLASATQGTLQVMVRDVSRCKALSPQEYWTNCATLPETPVAVGPFDQVVPFNYATRASAWDTFQAEQGGIAAQQAAQSAAQASANQAACASSIAMGAVTAIFTGGFGMAGAFINCAKAVSN